jgi:hypothetical protein
MNLDPLKKPVSIFAGISSSTEKPSDVTDQVTSNHPFS